MFSQPSFQQLSWSCYLQESLPSHSFSPFSPLNQCWSCISHSQSSGHLLSTHQHRFRSPEVQQVGFLTYVLCSEDFIKLMDSGVWDFRRIGKEFILKYFVSECFTIDVITMFSIGIPHTFFHTNVKLYKLLRTRGLFYSLLQYSETTKDPFSNFMH